MGWCLVTTIRFGTTSIRKTDLVVGVESAPILSAISSGETSLYRYPKVKYRFWEGDLFIEPREALYELPRP
jgi:hypothetical protein